MKLKLQNLKSPKGLMIASALFISASFTTFAQTQTWTGTTSTDFLDVTNWDDGLTPVNDLVIDPTSNDPVLSAAAGNVNHVRVNTGATLTIQAQMLIWAGGSNHFGSGTLNVEDGADINVRNQGRFGCDAGETQIINVSGGLLNTKNQLIIADEGDCTFNITGGLVTSTANGIILGGYNGVGIVNISGGALRLSGGLAIDDRDDRPGSGYITIDGDGVLELPGDQTAAVQPYIDADKIRSLNQNGSIQAMYDGRQDMTIVSVSLSINEVSFLKDVKITPNPTSGAFTVNLPVALQNITTEIYSINGALVATQKHQDNQTQLNINISSMASGVYVLKVLSNEGPMSFKLIKQ